MGKKIVRYQTSNGRYREGFLLKNNVLTVVATPFKWIEGHPITLHKKKNHVQILAIEVHSVQNTESYINKKITSSVSR